MGSQDVRLLRAAQRQRQLQPDGGGNQISERYQGRPRRRPHIQKIGARRQQGSGFQPRQGRPIRLAVKKAPDQHPHGGRQQHRELRPPIEKDQESPAAQQNHGERMQDLSRGTEAKPRIDTEAGERQRGGQRRLLVEPREPEKDPQRHGADQHSVSAVQSLTRALRPMQ
jgi:hypothetical protein